MRAKIKFKQQLSFNKLCLFILFIISTNINFSQEQIETNITSNQIDEIEINSEPNENNIIDSTDHLHSGDLYFVKNQYGEAHFEYLNYIETKKSLNDKALLILAYRNIGYRYKAKYLYDAALDFYLQALSISIVQNDLTTGHIYSAIGDIYYDQLNYNMAQEYYQKSLDLFITINARDELAAPYNNLGEMYRFKGEFNTALDFYQKAIMHNKEFNNKINLGINYENISVVYLAQNKLGLAYSYILKSQTLYLNINNVDLIASSYTNLGNYYQKKNHIKKRLANI